MLPKQSAFWVCGSCYPSSLFRNWTHACALSDIDLLLWAILLLPFLASLFLYHRVHKKTTQRRLKDDFVVLAMTIFQYAFSEAYQYINPSLAGRSHKGVLPGPVQTRRKATYKLPRCSHVIDGKIKVAPVEHRDILTI